MHIKYLHIVSYSQQSKSKQTQVNTQCNGVKNSNLCTHTHTTQL